MMTRALLLVGRLIAAALAAVGLLIVGTVVADLIWNRYNDEGCTCPTWGNPSWPHRHGCPVGER